MVLLKFYILLAVTVTVTFNFINCFNISPSPNIILKRDDTPTVQTERRSAYFGYTVNLRKNSVMVGAPRSQSVLNSQRNINETGTIYKCDLMGSNVNKQCYPYTFDDKGNRNVQNTDFNEENKEYQMLGGSMDGLSSESNKFVVCAPNLKDISKKNNDLLNYYFIHGICFWVSDTKDKKPTKVTQITNSRDSQSSGELHHAQQGFSVHVTEKNQEFLIGVPGASKFSKGTVFRYKSNGRIERVTIPNKIPAYSYFGYAVNSGYLSDSKSDLFYIASAPRNQTVAIFYDLWNATDFNLTLVGSQMGEYYGYSLLVEDFNNDTLPDLVVGAPLFSKNTLFENGAVYVYMNQKNTIKNQFSFLEHLIVTSDYEQSGRFGNALSKIGDINMDGYNDIAISAPFERNGVVYIYLGSHLGLSSKPSQILQAPTSDALTMFGHAISRGVDIDNNNYNDIAIGAPNSNTVYIYKSYPVVKMAITLSSLTLQLLTKDTEFTIEVCANYSSPGPINNEIDIKFNINAEPRHNPSFEKGKSVLTSVKDFKFKRDKSCFTVKMYYNCSTANIYLPIEIGMTYNLTNKVPTDSNVFCETCVIEDPTTIVFNTLKIPISTGCKGKTCVSDLTLTGNCVNIEKPFILGSSNALAVFYNIFNSGETAYFVELTITIPKDVKFSQNPSNCNINKEQTTMKCDVNVGKQLNDKKNVNFTATFDVSRLTGTEFEVNAIVSSSSDELKDEDNKLQLILPLEEFSEIELKAVGSPEFIAMIEEGTALKQIHNEYTIVNNGPSNVDQMIVAILIPTSLITKSNQVVNLVNSNDVTFHDSLFNIITTYSIEKNNPDFTKMNITTISKQSVINLSPDKTVFMDCSYPQEHFKCEEFRFLINSLSKGDTYEFTVDYSANIIQFDQIFNEAQRTALFQLGARVQRPNDIELKTIKITHENPFIIIYARELSVPLWIVLCSIILGILLLILLTFGVYKCGFFKRPLKKALSNEKDDKQIDNATEASAPEELKL
ncbi:unnamed protein product [Diamesa hyperborea]